MDCNNNDGSNYIYQMQRTMNQAMNGVMNNSNIQQQTQQQQTINYDKKAFDLTSNTNNSTYLNSHHSSITPPNSNSLTNNMPTSMPNNVPNNMSTIPITSNSRQYNAINSNLATRPTQFADYNNFNPVPTNFYNNYDRNNLQYNQPNQMNHHSLNSAPHTITHPVNHQINHSVNASVNSTNQSQTSKERPPSVHMPYDHQTNLNASTNPVYNQPIQSSHLTNNQLSNNVHHHPTLSSNQSNLSSIQSTNSVHHHHHPQQQAHQIASTQHSTQNLRPHHPASINPSLNTNQTNYAPTYSQVHPHVQHHPYNSNLNSNSPVNSNNNNAAAAGFNPHQHHSNYDPNYYTNYGDQWTYQAPLSNTASSPPQPIGHPPQVQQINNLNQSITTDSQQSNQQQQSTQKMHNLTNLNNSANLSQPYSNMHISNPMNNSMNSSINNAPISSPLNNSNQTNSFHLNQTSNNYLAMNNSGNSINYTPYPSNQNVDNNQQQQQYHLASSPNIQQQLQYHQMQPLPSSHLNSQQLQQQTTQINNNNVNSQHGQNQPQQSNHLSALDETLDAVVNGTVKPKRRRGKGKQTKEGKGKKEAKATSAYALFFKKVQNEIKKSHPKMEFGQISKTVAHQWASLPEEDKQSFKSITDRERKCKLEELAKEKAMKIISQSSFSYEVRVELNNDNNDLSVKKEDNQL